MFHSASTASEQEFTVVVGVSIPSAQNQSKTESECSTIGHRRKPGSGEFIQVERFRSTNTHPTSTCTISDSIAILVCSTKRVHTKLGTRWERRSLFGEIGETRWRKS